MDYCAKFKRVFVSYIGLFSMQSMVSFNINFKLRGINIDLEVAISMNFEFNLAM